MPKSLCYLKYGLTGKEAKKVKERIIKFADDRNFNNVQFIEESIESKRPWKDRTIGSVLHQLEKGDRLILTEMSCLGKSILEIMVILSSLEEKGINIYDVHNSWDIDSEFDNKAPSFIFSIVAQIERKLIRTRTKAGLQAAREKGKILGRPQGTGKSRLDSHKNEIISLLKSGSKKAYIAKKYHTSPPNLQNWLKKHDLHNVKPEY
jgi:DNA invertase Pin-like site-specific DNA recombinase